MVRISGASNIKLLAQAQSHFASSSALIGPASWDEKSQISRFTFLRIASVPPVLRSLPVLGGMERSFSWDVSMHLMQDGTTDGGKFWVTKVDLDRKEFLPGEQLV